MHLAQQPLRLAVAVVVCGLLLMSTGSGAAPDPFTPLQRAHWSFQPPRRVSPPVNTLKDASQVSNPVDAFVLSELESRAMGFSTEADKATLLRRVYLDVVGVSPTPQEVAAFAADQSEDAYEVVVDHLLASPRYGERWARHWLDLARYAESEGFKADETRPNAWRYRDYVVKSLNADKPYDRFVQEQIAGDELWPEDAEALVATGFNRHYPDESNARNLMQRRQEILNDITDTVGSVFSGLTFACARCHNHKFDPITQEDYFRLQSFFANTAADDNISLLFGEAKTRYAIELKNWEEATCSVRAEMDGLEAPKRAEIISDYVDKYPEEIQIALKKPESQRSPFECQMVAKAKLYIDPNSHQYLAPSKAAAARLKGQEKERWEALNAELGEYVALHPGPLPLATGISDLSGTAPATHLLKRGNWDSPDKEVSPGFLSILDSKPAIVAVAKKDRTTGRRATLAKWLTNPANPLTARVMVNRLWHHHFGRGLVGTPSDFGVKGELPTHPAMLDWLANEFVDQNWSLKSMHRLMLTSRTYRQSSAFRADLAKIDSDNRYLWRFPRQRLEGEVIRDNMLFVSGRLNPKMGGSSVFPALPPGMESRGGWKLSADPLERDRRSVYVFVRRNTRYPMFEAFDMPDTHEPCARRNQTTSPLQALTLLNSELSYGWAGSLAERVVQESGSLLPGQIERAYLWVLGRKPTDQEQRLSGAFIESQARRIQATAAADPEGGVSEEAVARRAALKDLCHALMNSNEFVYRF